MLLLTDRELFGLRRFPRSTRRRRSSASSGDLLSRLVPGVYVVHVDHGIERVQDRDVPVIVFRDRAGPGFPKTGFAKVYIFREGAGFNVDQLREENGKAIPASQCTAIVATLGDLSGVVYVIVHTGPTLDPVVAAVAPQRVVALTAHDVVGQGAVAVDLDVLVAVPR